MAQIGLWGFKKGDYDVRAARVEAQLDPGDGRRAAGHLPARKGEVRDLAGLTELDHHERRVPVSLGCSGGTHGTVGRKLWRSILGVSEVAAHVGDECSHFRAGIVG